MTFPVDHMTVEELLALSFLCQQERVTGAIPEIAAKEVLELWARHREWFYLRAKNMSPKETKDLIVADLEAVQEIDPFSDEEMDSLKSKFGDRIRRLASG